MSDREVTEPRLRCVLPFEAAPAEVRVLRRAAARQLSRWGVPAVAEEAELLVTEMATNVIKHVGEGASSTLILEWRGERLRLEVHDKSRTLPTVKVVRYDEECGRGLQLLAALAVDWGTVLTEAGKAVWCEIDLRAGRGCRRLERAALMLESYQSIGRTTHGTLARRREACLRETAVELIADLLHWATSCGFDPDDVLDQAQIHYEAAPDIAA
ncbi:ATP-binding protein [Streptomyces hirsutus]|uniref:ATP-binding protein n=1 Tax=Streptomyces hirsutus TaxID=35620 RepID=UPI0036A24916